MKIINLKIYNEIKNLFENNKVLKVFTKEYKDETLYQLLLEKNINVFKLKSNNFDVDENIKLLKKRDFNNNFKIKSN